MTATTVAELLRDLGVAQSQSRPTISDDNPYAESQFKTLTYGPSYLERVASLEAARSWMRHVVRWYNHEHRQSGIALLPPAVVHSGRATEVIAKRQATLDAAYQAHPERVVRGGPQAEQVARVVGMNLPNASEPEPPTATAAPLPAAAPASRDEAAQRPRDAGGAGGHAQPKVLRVEGRLAPHFA